MSKVKFMFLVNNKQGAYNETKHNLHASNLYDILVLQCYLYPYP